MVRPKEIPNATFTYQKIFGEDEFFAAGILRIEVGGCKAPKNSRDNAYVSWTIVLCALSADRCLQQVFFVQQGCVEVTIHRTRFLMSEGGAFLIPRGELSVFPDSRRCTQLRSPQVINMVSVTSARRKSSSASPKRGESRQKRIFPTMKRSTITKQQCISRTTTAPDTTTRPRANPLERRRRMTMTKKRIRRRQYKGNAPWQRRRPKGSAHS